MFSGGNTDASSPRPILAEPPPTDVLLDEMMARIDLGLETWDNLSSPQRKLFAAAVFFQAGGWMKRTILVLLVFVAAALMVYSITRSWATGAVMGFTLGLLVGFLLPRK